MKKTKTATDRIIPYYVWFIWGFGYISIFMGIISFGMSLITMVTVKGIYIPLWLIPIIAVAGIVGCMYFGYFLQKKDIQNRIASHYNQHANPEISQLVKDMGEIKEILKSREKLP